jgi:hypothetical protein
VIMVYIWSIITIVSVIIKIAVGTSGEWWK